MITRLFILSLAGLLAASGARSEEKARSEANKLVGTWHIVSGEADGKPVPEEKIEKTSVVITKDTIHVEDNEHKQNWMMTYKLVASTKPYQIDMTLQGGESKGQKALGIYELDGDNLKLCYALSGQERPATFATKAGTHQLLFVMKRVKR